MKHRSAFSPECAIAAAKRFRTRAAKLAGTIRNESLPHGCLGSIPKCRTAPSMAGPLVGRAGLDARSLVDAVHPPAIEFLAVSSPASLGHKVVPLPGPILNVLVRPD